MKRAALAIAILSLWLASPVFAAKPGEMLADPVLEYRAEMLGRELRCPVCESQSIEDSDADLSHDLRVLVRQKLSEGASDAQVKQFLVARYGDYILLDPPFKPETLALWLGPAILLLAALAAAILFYSRTRNQRPVNNPLAEEERARLTALIGESTPFEDQPR